MHYYSRSSIKSSWKPALKQKDNCWHPLYIIQTALQDAATVRDKRERVGFI
jgi:hypothetical protein